MTRIATIHREPPPVVHETPATRLLRQAWAADFPVCWWCVHTHQRRDREIDTHHIIGGSLRTDEPCNWSRLCRWHHDLVEERPKLIGAVLRLKELFDPKNHNPDRLRALGGNIPESLG